MEVITSLEQLKVFCFNKQKEFFIRLNFGVKSSKSIIYDSDSKKFEINNEIDSTNQVLTEKELFTKSNIGIAIERNSLYMYKN
jgi:hypothetical protein